MTSCFVMKHQIPAISQVYDNKAWANGRGKRISQDRFWKSIW